MRSLWVEGFTIIQWLFFIPTALFDFLKPRPDRRLLSLGGIGDPSERSCMKFVPG